MRFENGRHLEHEKAWLKAFVAFALVAAGFALGGSIHGNEDAAELVRAFGYFGVFLAAVVSGFNLVVPVPAVAFLPTFLAAGLDLWPTILVMSLGVTLADSIAFLIGNAGRSFARRGKARDAVRWLEKLRERSPAAPLAALAFVAAFVPIPNEVVALPLGLMGYRFRAVFATVLCGNLVFNTLFAHGVAGFYGLS